MCKLILRQEQVKENKKNLQETFKFHFLLFMVHRVNYNSRS